MDLSVEYGDRACIGELSVNGQKVISGENRAYTSITIGGIGYSSLHLLSAPTLKRTPKEVKLIGIVYGGGPAKIREDWTFTLAGEAISWTIARRIEKPVNIDASSTPVFDFDSINTWDGAYQGYGGLAWFYLFDERQCTYGVHTCKSSFWNSRTGNGLDVVVIAPGKQVAMKYTRTGEDRLAFGVTVSPRAMLPRYDSGTNRRRFIRGREDVWAPFLRDSGTRTLTVRLNAFDVKERYGRGVFAGVDGQKVAAVLNTVARIGVIDSLHFGGNSWHTPYGPICLHEQYIAQLGLGIDDPEYLNGYQSCLDYYRDHAIQPTGRVYARWAYTDEDRMPGKGNKAGFYEAQWGILMDANPDYVSNVSDLFNLSGNRQWVGTQRSACEKALDWILERDRNGNGLVEMMTDNEKAQQSSDWIDIIWASYENAFVNAKLYHALIEWSAIERQLGNAGKASAYERAAAKLKISFNKPIASGGFWDEEQHCYVHWLDKDGSPHGTNIVTPVNFMAIAYGLCDDTSRRNAILDNIETLMQREDLFFWPLCMTSYKPGEGKSWQFPFPAYENGDLFLSWGSVAVEAYAGYKPQIALKYIKKVLDRYSRDGLAFQRYGRLKQDGLGDDILSGNSLTIVGLYHSIYGIDPRYNRLYLHPHLTPELAGTRLRYRFRGDELSIGLSPGNYSIGDSAYTLSSGKDFGYSRHGDRLFYFDGGEELASLEVASKTPLTITIGKWGRDIRQWTQRCSGPQRMSGLQHTRLTYAMRSLEPRTTYKFFEDGKLIRTIKTNDAGELTMTCEGSGALLLQISASR